MLKRILVVSFLLCFSTMANGCMILAAFGIGAVAGHEIAEDDHKTVVVEK